MIQIDKELINSLFDKAVVSDRKRMNYDLRTSSNDSSQRMLNPTFTFYSSFSC